MKLSCSFIASSLLCVASAISKEGHVYVYDPITNASPQPPTTVTPVTARLILAQRLGLSRFHSIEQADDKLIRNLNAYGGSQQKLFGGEDKQRTKAHLLVWIEDVEDTTAIIKDESRYSTAFTISDPPSTSLNDRLLGDLTLQAASLPTKPDPKKITYSTVIETEALLSAIKDMEIHNDFLGLFRASRADKLDFSVLSSSLEQLLAKSVAAKDQGFPITIFLMPPSSSHSKRAANSYGTYDLPSAREARGEPTEALLSPSTQTAFSQNSPSDLEDSPVIQIANTTTPVLGILPACFESLNACQRTTQNCSSHGSCKLLHKGRNDLKTLDCYGCACSPTIKIIQGEGMEEREKITYWGGPACQKKDISVPFFLFASIGIILAGLIAASIGAMFSMGNQELPSVIGAGVSGPVRK